MAEPQSLVRLDAYRKATAPDVEFGPTWWDRHGSILKADDREIGPDGRVKKVRTPFDFGQSGPTAQRPSPARMSTSRPPLKRTSRPPRQLGSKSGARPTSYGSALFDMLVGAMAVAIPSLNSTNLGPHEPLIVTLSLLGAIVWPATVAGARGYDRRRIGFGNDEVRSILRAAMGLVLVGAFWAGLFGTETFLKLAVVATPSRR